ncbi:endonuclease/exonuclease/phosphatase family protein [Pseudotenacibaculum haliotis]|uniref:Endonuclease/exonuclease/phosphatase family protein n=1 Tax=Pseudotenacibaculum haliotis TaxID=1862138 RepID=A0ABW5LUN2_9FLAO
MKKKSKTLSNRFIFLINTIVAVVLLLSYILPYISPERAPILAILSLFVPIMILANILFAIYWVLRLKKEFFLSTFVVLVGYGYLGHVYKLSGKEILMNDDLKIMSYNVKMFNHYGWNTNDSIASKMYDFIKNQDPDILTIQEFYHGENIQIDFPYQYIKTKAKKNKFGMATYSKFPIVNSGSLDLQNTSNNIIFTDIVKGMDTIRIYNIHLESFGIKPDQENFGEENSDRLMKRMKKAFKQQAIQTEIFLEHQASWRGKSIITGDFNNTAFSWVYRQIAKDKQDAFKVAGKGLGKTFDYSYPLRIDFILPDTHFEVHHFQNFDVKYSDHFPIMARISLKKDFE